MSLALLLAAFDFLGMAPRVLGVVMMLLMLYFAWSSRAAGDDAVILRSESGDGETRIPGEIIEYTGRAIRVKGPGSLERNYAADRVVRFETEWTKEHLAGDKARAARDYALAIEAYRRALQQENRIWARRVILSELVWCYRAAGQLEAAGDAFLLLITSDPSTQYFDSIPLAWLASESVSPIRAERWLDRDDLPAARLLGASYLLTTPQRAAATAALADLAADADPRIAALATAQTWRTQFVQASAADTAAWQAAIEAMPAALQTGPYFVLGQALAAQKRYDDAALALLRVPVLEPRDPLFAAAALVLAAQAQEQGGRTADARRLYQEVVDGHPASRWRTEAEQRLAQLQSN